MNRVLKSKKDPDHLWAAVWNDPHRYVSVVEMQTYIAEATQRIAALEGNFILAWSGGKDSVAVRSVLRMMGEDEPRSMQTMAEPELEAPVIEEYAATYRPVGCRVFRSHDWAWVCANPRRLFPADIAHHKTPLASLHAEWNRVKWVDQYRAARDRGVTNVLTGRRRSDGNVCGPSGRTGRNGITVVNPIFDWPHEATIAVIRMTADRLCPLYHEPRGYATGLRAWPMYPSAYVRDRFPELYAEWLPRIRKQIERQTAAGYAPHE